MSRKRKKQAAKDAAIPTSTVKSFVGRPTKYTEDFPMKLINYFSTITTVKILDKEYPRFNSIEGFCASEMISKQTFYRWKDDHTLFSDAYRIIKQYQADQLMQLSANRIFDAGYAKLLTVNCTDLREKPVEDKDDKEDVQHVVIDDQDTKL